MTPELLLPEMSFIPLIAYGDHRPYYWVRFSNSIKGKPTIISHKRFYFHEFEGGQEEALFWAQDWRDWEYPLLLERGLINKRHPWVEKAPPCYTGPRSTNTTGKCGVQRSDYFSIVQYKKKDGSISFYKKHNLAYAAVWIEYVLEKGGISRKYRNKRFSIRKHGEEAAKRMASEARDKVEEYLVSECHKKLRDEYLKGRKSV